jgi:hypothetical protein
MRPPRVIITDKLASYGAAKRELMPSVNCVNARTWTGIGGPATGAALCRCCGAGTAGGRHALGAQAAA